MATFNPQKHTRDIKGKTTIDAKWKVRWFRDVHPDGRIDTDAFTVGDMIAVKAIVMDAEGHFLASGMATARDEKGATWSGRVIEKAETAAIARALAHAGFSVESLETAAQSNRAQKQAPAKSLDPDDYLPPSNATSISAWNEADMTKFWQRWNKKEQIASAEILKALGVSKLSEWPKSLGDANVAMQKYLNEAETA